MTIIAIDPGPIESGYIVITSRWEIKDKGTLTNEALLDKINDIRSCFMADCLVLEQVACMGMPAGESMFETVFNSGRFCERWGKKFHRIKRHEVKMHICGNMRAKDANIRQALIDKYGEPGTKKAPGLLYGIKGHLWSALALADTFFAMHKPAAI